MTTSHGLPAETRLFFIQSRFAWAALLRRAVRVVLRTGVVSLVVASGIAQTQTYSFTTLAGSPGVPGISDGRGSAARFNGPSGIAVDRSGNVYVADRINETIRRITPDGAVTTFAGSPGSPGNGDGLGGVARFSQPEGIVVSSAGNIFVSDSRNRTIRRITSLGVVSTYAGTAGRFGSNDGTGSVARFNQPYGLAIDGTDAIYVADNGNRTIRKITGSAVVTTLAGYPESDGATDGIGEAVRFNNPWSVATDRNGNVYVADTGNNSIRKITSAGVVSTLAGSFTGGGTADGVGTAARFRFPTGVVVDPSGNVLVADSANHAIRLITPGGVVTTLAGRVGESGSADGTNNVVRFKTPHSLAFDGNGNVYVSDSDDHTIRKGTPVTSINSSPANTIAAIGGSATLSVSASGSGLTYEWQLNGANVAGATNSTLTLNNVQPRHVGSYAVTVSNSSGSRVTSDAASVTLTPARLANLSVRTVAGSGNQVLSAGFVVAGGDRQLLVRGIGPTLGLFGLSGVLADPQLRIFSGTRQVQANDDWGGGTVLSSAFDRLGAFALPAVSKDAALLATLSAGAYVSEITSTTGAGIALVEVYDATAASSSPTTARMVNVSTRTFVGTGDNILAAGFFLAGSTAKTVLIRGIGPSLAQFGVPGVLENPQLKLFVGKTELQANDDWGGGPTLSDAFAQLGAFPLAANSKDAALLVTLDPGLFIVEVSGVNNSTGVALVEIYDADDRTPTITTNQAVRSGSGAIFSVTATGALGYQWQRLPAGSTTWVNISDGGDYSGASTATLTVRTLASGDKFRAVAANLSRTTTATSVGLATTGAITLSKTSANPGETIQLRVAGATLDPNLPTTINFSDAAGNILPVAASAVTTGGVDVCVPYWVDPQTFVIGPKAVSVSCMQSSDQTTTVYAANATLNIADLPTTTLPPGTVTVAILQQLEGLMKSAASNWADIETYSKGTMKTGAVAADLALLQSQFAGSQALLQQLQAKSVNRLDLGTLSGSPVAMDTSSLALLDRIYLAYFFEGNPPRAVTSAQVIAGRVVAAAGEIDPLTSIFDQFKTMITADIPEKVFESAKRMSAAGKVALGVGTVVAVALAGASAPAVLTLSLAGAILFNVTTWAPAAVGISLQGAGNQILNGKATPGDLAATGKFVKNSVLDKLWDYGTGRLFEKYGLGHEIKSESVQRIDKIIETSASTISDLKDLVDPNAPASVTNATATNLDTIRDNPNNTRISVRYAVILDKDGAGTVTMTPLMSSYVPGMVVAIFATPASGSTFVGWTGGATGTATAQLITVNSNLRITGVFSTPTPTRYLLTLNQAGTGSGTVVAIPSIGPNFPAGTVVTLIAAAAGGSTFNGWSGDVTGSATPQTITMNANKTVTATFNTSAVSLTGTWVGTSSATEAGFGTWSMTETWVITQSGSQISGTQNFQLTSVPSRAPDRVGDRGSGSISGTISGNSISLATGSVSWTGTLSGNTMSGTRSAVSRETGLPQTGPFSMTKQ